MSPAIAAPGRRPPSIATAFADGRTPGSDPEKRPARNLQLETLAGVLDGEILVHNHCYRADEMATMINLAREFGYKITSFHHAVEAYKIRDLLVENNICASMWADWWGFKLEAYDGIRENIALVDQAKGCAIVHSDDANGIQRLNQEAAKALAGRARGRVQDRARRCGASGSRSIPRGRSASTRSPARSKPARTPTSSSGPADPFSVYSRAERVFIDGALDVRPHRSEPATAP